MKNMNYYIGKLPIKQLFSQLAKPTDSGLNETIFI